MHGAVVSPVCGILTGGDEGVGWVEEDAANWCFVGLEGMLGLLLLAGFLGSVMRLRAV